MPPKKILIILNSFNIGGAEKQAFKLLTYLKSKDYPVQVLTFSENGPLKEKLGAAGIEFSVLDIDFYFLKNIQLANLFSLSGLKFYLKRKKLLSKINNHIKKLNPQVIIPFTFFPNIIAGMFAQKNKDVTAFWNQRDLAVEGWQKNEIEMSSVNSSGHFIANSNEVAKHLQEYYQVDKNKISIIKNGIKAVSPQNNRENWRNSILKVSEEKIVVTMISNFHTYKNHLFVVDLWNKIISKPEFADKSLLVFAGRFGGGEIPVKKRAAELGIENKIIFLDYVEDVQGLLNASDVFVFTSQSEGSPNVVLEAMISGLPIVASSINPVKELLGNDYTYLADNSSENDFSVKLIRLISDKNIREEIGKAIKANAQKNYSLEAMCEGYVNLINKF